MNINSSPSFIQNIAHRLTLPLPGEAAQYRMAPSYRPRMKAEEIQSLNPRIGGVLILLFEQNNQWHTVFTQRRRYEGVHSGQMSFPGGRFEDGDEDIIQTALREAEEEVGISRGDVDVLGRLTELYIPPSNFLVYPVVAHLRGEKNFIPQEREVEKIVETPLSFFLNSENVKQTTIHLSKGLTTSVPAFIYEEHVIWGATAIMLSEFREVLMDVM